MSGKVKCDELRCGWQGTTDELLTAPHPFMPNEHNHIDGCPKCRQCGTIIQVCDKPGCWNPASCGAPTPDGYRSTCGNHMPRADLKIAASIRNDQQNRRTFVDDRRTFKAGCTITNIRKGVGKREKVVYADLVDRDGVLIISATLSYIAGQLSSSRICETDEPQMEYEQ